MNKIKLLRLEKIRIHQVLPDSQLKIYSKIKIILLMKEMQPQIKPTM